MNTTTIQLSCEMPRIKSFKHCQFIGCNVVTGGPTQLRDIKRHERTCNFKNGTHIVASMPQSLDRITIGTIENEPEPRASNIRPIDEIVPVDENEPESESEPRASSPINQIVSVHENESVSIAQSPINPNTTHVGENTTTDVFTLNSVHVRISNETPRRVSALDLIQALKIADNVNVCQSLKRLTEEFTELRLIRGNKLKFGGERQHKTPVVDAVCAMKLVNRINGPHASAFRESSSDRILFSMFGGDIATLSQIRETARREYALFDSQSTSVLNVDVARMSEVITAERLKEILGAISACIPDSVHNKCVVYLMCVGYDPVTQRYIFKFGKTDDYKERKKAHKKEFPFLIEIFVISLGMYEQSGVENAIKDFSEVASRRTKVVVNIGGKVETRTEFFMSTQDEYHLLSGAIFNMLCVKYHDMIEAKYFHANSSPIDNIRTSELALELAKAKTAEALAKVAEAPYKLAKEVNRKQILDFMHSHPDKFDELMKYLG